MAFLILEDLQRPAPGGAVNPHSGDITAPASRFFPEVSQAFEVAALEEALADVLDAPLHLGLVLGVSHPGGIGDEPPVLGVFQEAPGEPGVQRVAPRHRGGEVVDDQILGDAAEEGPGRLQSGDDVFQFLAEGGPDEAVPGVTQHHDQRPHRPAAARFRVLDQTQTAEVQLRHLAGRGVLHPDRAAAPAPPVAAGDEPVQGRVGYLTPSGCQQLLNSGELQALDVEPPVDLVCPRAQQFLAGRLRLSRAGTADAGQPAELVLGGGRTLLDHAGLLGRRQVLPDRVPGQASPRCYVALAVPSLPAPYDFCDFHSEHLPVRHHHSSLRSVAMVADKAPKGGLMTLVSVLIVNVKGKGAKRRGGKAKPVRHQLHRTPTSTQQARWEAVQQAREQGLSLRAISRNLGMARDTVGKYLKADSPSTKKFSAKEFAKAEALAASSTAAD